jgi:hypothetical protein
MKVLVITERVDKNHDLFGFFHSRLIDFAKECEQVTIICLEEREHNLPSNVVIHSLGKEKRRSRFQYIYNFYRYIWIERKNYGRVFVHLTPLYAVLGGPVWRVLGKQVVLWYNHTFTDLTLRIAEKFVQAILTTNKARLGIPQRKIHVIEGKVDLEAYLQFIKDTKST